MGIFCDFVFAAVFLFSWSKYRFYYYWEELSLWITLDYRNFPYLRTFILMMLGVGNIVSCGLGIASLYLPKIINQKRDTKKQANSLNDTTDIEKK